MERAAAPPVSSPLEWKRPQRIDARRSPRGNVAGDERDEPEHHGNGGVRHRIGGLPAEELAFYCIAPMP